MAHHAVSTFHRGDMFVEVLMLRVLPFVSVLGGTPHKPNVLVNPTQSRWYRGSFDERAGTKWTESSALFLQKNIKYTEYFYSLEQLDQTSPHPTPPPAALWVFVKQRQKGVGGVLGGCNKMHWMTGEMRTKEMMVKPKKDWNLMERKELVQAEAGCSSSIKPLTGVL